MFVKSEILRTLTINEKLHGFAVATIISCIALLYTIFGRQKWNTIITKETIYLPACMPQLHEEK